jgi:glycosyltransferase involved in cell wall biosynthesis
VKTNTPTISVLMPVYNTEKYLNEAIDSILGQSFSDFELIIIDDASTDNSINIINSYQDERIIFIQKEKNTGYTDSLNMGIQMAKGKYIARMDSDDISLPLRFEKQVVFLENNPEVILCGTQIRIIDTDNTSKLPIKNDLLKVKMIDKTQFYHPTIMLRKSLLDKENINYDKGKEPAEDYDLWSRLMFLGDIVNLSEVLLEYRVHHEQTSIVRRNIQLEKSNDIRNQTLKKIYNKINVNFNYFQLSDEFINDKYYLKELFFKLKTWEIIRKKNISKKIFNIPYLNNHIKQKKLDLLTDLLTIKKPKGRNYKIKIILYAFKFLGILEIDSLLKLYIKVLLNKEKLHQ